MPQPTLCVSMLVLALVLPACTPSLPEVPRPEPHDADAGIDVAATADKLAAVDLRIADLAVAFDAALVERGPGDVAFEGGNDRGPDLPSKPSADSGVDTADAESRPDAGQPAEAHEIDGEIDQAADDAGSPTERQSEAGARPPRPGDLAIVEILVNPADTDSGREWIEIANLAAEPLDLADLVVADESGEVAMPAGEMAPGALLVVGQSTDPTKNGGARVDLAWGIKISLNNDRDTISLCLGPCADGILLDRAGWADLGAAYNGRSLILTPGTGLRCPATTPFGAAGSSGTPGTANPPCP